MTRYVIDPAADLVPVCPNCHAMDEGWAHLQGSDLRPQRRLVGQALPDLLPQRSAGLPLHRQRRAPPGSVQNAPVGSDDVH